MSNIGDRVETELAKAREDARITAKVTGSIGATASRSWVQDGETLEVTAHYNRARNVCDFREPDYSDTCGRADEHTHALVPKVES